MRTFEKQDYGGARQGRPVPSIELQQRAFAAVANHPLFVEAASYAWWQPLVLLEPRSFLDRVQLSDETRQGITDSTLGSAEVLWLAFHTAAAEPEPLSGFGKAFNFILHPETLEVLHTSVSSWRS